MKFNTLVLQLDLKVLILVRSSLGDGLSAAMGLNAKSESQGIPINYIIPGKKFLNG